MLTGGAEPKAYHLERRRATRSLRKDPEQRRIRCRRVQPTPPRAKQTRRLLHAHVDKHELSAGLAHRCGSSSKSWSPPRPRWLSSSAPARRPPNRRLPCPRTGSRPSTSQDCSSWPPDGNPAGGAGGRRSGCSCSGAGAGAATGDIGTQVFLFLLIYCTASVCLQRCVVAFCAFVNAPRPWTMIHVQAEVAKREASMPF